MPFNINNESDVPVTYQGQTIAPGAFYTVADPGTAFALDYVLINDVIYGDTSITVKTATHRGQDALAILSTIRSAFVSITSAPLQSPFAAKKIGTKNLVARTTGVSYAVTTGATTLLFTIAYPWVKINGVEIIGAVVGDSCNFKVFDTAAGTYSTIPNYQLNQFGFNVQMAPGFYQRISDFDADLYEGMVLQVEYTSVSNKNVGINYILTEMK